MKLKYFSIFVLLFLLICCANATYAASDDNILGLDHSEDIISQDGNEIAKAPLNANDHDVISTNDQSLNGATKESDSSAISATDSDDILAIGSSSSSSGSSTAYATGSSASTSSAKSDVTSVSSYSGLAKALKNGEKKIVLTSNIKISKPLQINSNVVIDGNGHTIDAQKKTRIFKIYAATVTIKNLKFKHGKADKGGAVNAYKSTLNLKNCAFIGNRATRNGGAVYLYVGRLNDDGSTYIGNLANNGGGAIYVSAAKLVVKNSNFEKNKVESSKKSGHGGAVYVCKKTSSITNSTFKANQCLSKSCKSHGKATKYQFSGGAIYISGGSNHKLVKCTFASSKATNHGGALYFYQSSSVTINKCTFKFNKVAYEDGGAISSNAKKLVIKNSYFYKNHAYEDGGVMDALSLNKKKVHITIAGCNFKANSAYKGGGVFWMGKKTAFNIKNCNFTSNKAGMGGTLFAEATTSKVTNCIFQGNQAKKVASWTVRTKGGSILNHCGGAIVLQNKKLQISKCIFKKNSATIGGVIFQSGGKLKLSSNKFSGNSAKTGSKIKKI